jgi:large conductance mechanosensitive channel
MKKLLEEFKTFALKGNVVDLAVGVIIGAAFGKIVSSIVEDLMMPIIGSIWKADFTNLYVGLSSAVREAAEKNHLSLADARKVGPVFAYGNFITILINFAIVAFCVFMLVKGINALARKKKEEAAPPPPPTPEVVLLTEIRDLLKAKP